MLIRRHKTFKKHFQSRIENNRKLLKQFEERVALFMSGHRGQPINDHALAGSMKGLRSFSVSGDIRIIYREIEAGYEFIDIGTHAQVYDLR